MRSKTTEKKQTYGKKPGGFGKKTGFTRSEKNTKHEKHTEKTGVSRTEKFEKKPSYSSREKFEKKPNSSRYEKFEKKPSSSRFDKFSPKPGAVKDKPIKILSPADDAPEPESLILEGRKAVLEALNHEKPVDRVLIRKEPDKPIEGTLRVIAAKAKARGLVVQEVNRAKLDELSETGHHQGVVALCPAVGYVEISEILEIAKQKGEQPFVIVLDGVTDPHNLGAVLRSAEAGGAHGVIVPKRRAVGLTGTVAKTSAGAIEHMPVARVTNITQALAELKKAGLWIACADMTGKSMFESEINGPVALVLGAEGVGVSRLVREQSDYAVSIPMLGKIASLNVSVAAGVLIYEVVRRRSR